MNWYKRYIRWLARRSFTSDLVDAIFEDNAFARRTGIYLGAAGLRDIWENSLNGPLEPWQAEILDEKLKLCKNAAVSLN